MSNIPNIPEWNVFTVENAVQPIDADYSTDGLLDEYARVDHQHPLSVALRSFFLYAMPLGMMMMWPTSTAPTLYLVCDGAAISRTTYADLFALLGTSYGAGDGSTTFNIPDMRGRSPMGSGTGSGLTNRVLGTNYGEENHTLTASESGTTAHGHGNGTLGTANDSPDHSHSGTTNNEGSHRHGQYVTGGAAGGGSLRYDYNGDGNYTAYEQGVWTGAGEAHAHGFGTGGASVRHQHGITGAIASATAASASAGHNTIHPVKAVNFIMKVL